MVCEEMDMTRKDKCEDENKRERMRVSDNRGVDVCDTQGKGVRVRVRVTHRMGGGVGVLTLRR